MSDDLTLATRAGLPPDWLYLRDQYPRSRWADPALHPTAAHWLAMHDSFRAQTAQMGALTAGWRADPVQPRALHDGLIPTLQAFLQHLDAHHRIESGHYFPAFRRIEPRIAAGVDLLDRDHDAVHAHLDALVTTGRAFHQAVATGAAEAADCAHRLAEALDAAAPALTRHLEDEEDIVIPLLALRGDPVV